MERGSDKHGPIQDEELDKELHGRLQGGHPTRAEEEQDVEPPADDDPPVADGKPRQG